MKNEIVLYQSGELSEHIEVRLKEETVWLNRIQISTLFGRDVKTIGKHINNVFSEGELSKDSTVANFATVQLEGERKIERQIEFYNLDVIISVGYRVKSKQGTQFCNWATMSLLQKRKVMAKNNSQFTTPNSKTERNHLALSTKNCRTFWRPTSGGD